MNNIIFLTFLLNEGIEATKFTIIIVHIIFCVLKILKILPSRGGKLNDQLFGVQWKF